ncbi:MAG: type II toxin-antitoxin system prevent-host-death family antitoxin [Candidatus Latescibacteria bacterium]|nr:type II toxin-antitoxin system prevent-host-death family antitoxin [Candidatus Latescibacterota bacterium]
MSKPIKASVAKQHFDHLLEGVRTQGEQYEIQEEGRTVAVLIPPADFQAFHQQQRLKEQAWTDLEALLEKVHARNAHIPPEQVARDVEAAIREVRAQKKR